jgi:hypothetical protein
VLNSHSNAPEYYFFIPSLLELKIKMIAEATKDAGSRAKASPRTLRQLGKLKKIGYGSFPNYSTKI